MSQLTPTVCIFYAMFRVGLSLVNLIPIAHEINAGCDNGGPGVCVIGDISNQWRHSSNSSMRASGSLNMF